MLNYESLFDDLADVGLPSWRNKLSKILEKKFSTSSHGKLGEWRTIISDLPAIKKLPADLSRQAVTIPCIDGLSQSALRQSLLRLNPWRKGPFDLCGVYINTEWRSDLKWERIKDSIEPLDGRTILDVGCGNGYYAMRMRGMGARLVIGIEPTLLYVIQFLAICHFIQAEPVHVLPIRLHELPSDSNAFDTVFSMGVLYHQKSLEEHLSALMSSLKSGGELILETLILPGTETIARKPKKRYARMRNVWMLPTLPKLESWLEDSGFNNIRLIDVSQTTTEEQRTTEWMPFESLANALDPTDPTRTIEGWPAPCRAALACNKP
jgi:tRNA (mo5U34)-methyltransferase